MGFSYDANGRMVKATKISVPDSNSVYDAAGLRVAERVNDIWRFLVYDTGGKIVAEYGGPQQTDDGGVKYVLSDWQGSTRAIVGNTGHVQSRMDYSTFGESISTGTGVLTAQQGFSVSDSLRQRYGLTERDEATGLDDTWFRKLENRGGRWTSPDPYNGSANIGNGQSWNRYSYVENQPTNYVDPSGLNSASPWPRPWGTYGGGFGEALFRWADNMWSSGGWSAEYSGGDHWAAEQGGIAFSGGDIGGFLNGPPLLPGIHINWSGGREPVILGFALVHSMNPTLVNSEETGVGGSAADGSERLERMMNCALGYYGIDPISVLGLSSTVKWGLIALAAGGVPKSAAAGLGLRVLTQPGSSQYTSAIRMLSQATGSEILKSVANFGKKYAGPIAIASAIIDATAIGICTALD